MRPSVDGAADAPHGATPPLHADSLRDAMRDVQRIARAMRPMASGKLVADLKRAVGRLADVAADAADVLDGAPARPSRAGADAATPQRRRDD